MFKLQTSHIRLQTSLFLLLFCLSLSAQPEMTQLQPGQTPDGVVYYLPKTALRIHLLIEKQTYTPGQFARYAERYLHLMDVVQQEQISQRIVNCEVSSFGVRDTSKCYSVRLKGKAETAEVRLSEQGTLLAVNDEPLAYSIPALSAPLTSHLSPLTSHQSLLSSEALAAGSTAKMAEITAQQIQELQERRQQLATGEADEMPQDEQQLRLMLQQIDQKCAQLMTHFTGTVRRDSSEHILTFCPDKDINHQVLFRISRRLGLVDKDDLSGTPYYIDLKNLSPDERPAPENKKQTGFYVNVPGLAQLTISQDDQTLAQFMVPLAQFGFTELRDGDLFRRYVTRLQLHPATGAVVRQQVEQEK
jgi:hypothetical protein